MIDNPERETHYAVPGFWVYAYNYELKQTGNSLYLTNKVEPDVAAALLAAYPPGHSLPHPDHPREHLPSYVSLRRATWQDREEMEPCDLPRWAHLAWWTDNRAIHADHCVRPSKTHPGLISYFQTAEKAARNIRTPIKAGRYLTKFFRDILSETEIAKMARWQETGALDNDYNDPAKYELRFAKTVDDIVSVYEDGPSSCMSGGTDEFSTDGMHPAAVYAAGDLAVAYLQCIETDKVTARALCWPAKTVFGRVYPTPDNWRSDDFACQPDSEAMQDALRFRLREAGYIEGQRNTDIFDGAKLRKIGLDDDCEYLMPYLDWGMNVDDAGGYFVIRRHGDYACDKTNGVLRIKDERPTCDNCDERCDADDLRTVYTGVSATGHPRFAHDWCEYCTDNHAFYCDGVHEYIADSVESVEVGNRTYSHAYAETNFFLSDYSGEWFDGDAVEMEDGEMWSEDEFAKHGFECAVTGEKLPIGKLHPDYPEISRDLDDEQLAEYLATRETKETIE